MEDKVLAVLGEINEKILNYEGSNLYQDGLLDSFEIMEIVERLEETFDIEIDANLVVAENFLNKDAIIHLIMSLVNETKK